MSKAVRVLALICVAVAARAQQPPADPVARSRWVLDQFFAGQYDTVYGLFAEGLRKAVPQQIFQRQGQATAEKLGKPQSIGEPETRTAGANTIVTIPVVWPAIALDFVMNWDAEGKLAMMTSRPKVAAWKRPAYSDPDKFEEQEALVGNDDWKLPGTLTLPVGPGPFPAVILVHGSGPNDRDESVGGVKVFKDLAEGLASKGIAVLRYDKVTRVYAPRLAANKDLTMTRETVDDAVRAVDTLLKVSTVDPKRIFVLGHSQGGYMLPRIAQRAGNKIAGVIALAGNVRPVEDLIVDQLEYLSSLKPALDDNDRKQVDDARKAAAAVKALEPGKEAPKLLGMNLPASYLLDLKGYDPAAQMRKLDTPILVLQGERDYQVTMKDFSLWKSALDGRKNAAFRSFPELNHLFVAGQGKSTPAEYQRPGHVAQEVLDEIANWMAKVRP